MMYLVSVVRDIDENNVGIEVAGIFDTEEKANEAKKKIRKWMIDNEYEDYVIYVTACEVNRLGWYEIEEHI